MKIIVNARNIDLTDAIKQYVQEKFARLEHHYDFVREIHVILAVEKNPSISEKHHAEAVVHANGTVARIDEVSDSLYASIDLLVDKVDRSMRKHKTKLLNRSHGRDESIRRVPESPLSEAELAAVPDDEGIYFPDEEEEAFTS